jgi:glycolate oxidase FAD binding subunit
VVSTLSPLARAAESVVDALRAGDDAVVVAGAGTHAGVGHAVTAANVRTVSLPSGIVTYDPDDMTVTALAGTTVVELAAAVGEAGQEVSLDPRSPDATIGGVLAAGLSGWRRLRHGPLRDTLLEVRFVDGRGMLVKGGGPVVKNVTGYDLPRLFVGSLGTLGAIVQVTLRCKPRAAAAAWFRVERDDPDAVRDALYRPSAVLFDGRITHVLLEGHDTDINQQSAGARLGVPTNAAPVLPDGAHRGRISVAPMAAVAVGRALGAVDVRWCAEIGVGTVHVATDGADDLVRAREIAVQHGGWLLREAGAPDIDAFGIDLPNRELAARVKAAFDPDDRFAPGRLPL